MMLIRLSMYLVVKIEKELFLFIRVVVGLAAAALLCRFLVAEDVETRGRFEGTGHRPDGGVDTCSEVHSAASGQSASDGYRCKDHNATTNKHLGRTDGYRAEENIRLNTQNKT